MRFLFSLLLLCAFLSCAMANMLSDLRSDIDAASGFTTMDSNSPSWPTATSAQLTSAGGSSAAPSVVNYQGTLYMAYTAGQPSGSGVCITGSSDGIIWSNCAWILMNDKSNNQPALAVFNNRVYLALLDTAPSNGVCVVSSNNPLTVSSWNSGCNWVLTNNQAYGGVSMTVYAGKLYMAFGASGGVGFCITSSSDGSTWSTSCNWIQTQVSNVQPSLFLLDTTLYLTWATGGDLFLSTSNDGAGATWSTAHQIETGASAVTSATPTIVNWGGILYFAYNTGGNNTLSVAPAWGPAVSVLSSFPMTGGASLIPLSNSQLVIVFTSSAGAVYSAVAN